ncbi:MAG: PAS domain-containing sensor histidine kinase [Bacteroidetes bacterium]|nr:MAG: PAS domain-containing sensor histidine kinase [Bacteroidota bacterium]
MDVSIRPAKEEEHKRILPDTIKTQVWYLSDPGTYGAVNKAHADFWGMKPANLAFKSFFDVFPEGRARKWAERNSRIFIKAEPASFEKWLTNANGERRLLSITKTPKVQEDGRVEYLVCSSEDITERAKLEIAERELEIVKKKVRIKQTLLANMSHEIRTHLTGVLGIIDVLKQTHMDDEQSDYVETLKSSGEHLKVIIDQVLDCSRIEAGKANIKPVVFGFKSLAEGAILLYKNSVKEQVAFNNEVDEKIPLYIRRDKFRLAQVLNNLVSNALKFTHQGSVTIKSSLVSQNFKTGSLVLKFEVIDTGVGIPTHLQASLFTPFSQIELPDKREYEGTGLGLSICKELTELMGGEMGVKSTQGKGSIFWFTFIAKIAEKENPLADNSNLAILQNIRILFADDKAVNQKVISLLLKDMGHEIQVVNNGKEALDIYEPGKFDLILMDIQMPVMDGVTATQKLKKKHQNLPPIVGLSANAFEGDREKYMALGLDGYLTKPFNRVEFSNLLSKIF